MFSQCCDNVSGVGLTLKEYRPIIYNAGVDALSKHGKYSSTSLGLQHYITCNLELYKVLVARVTNLIEMYPGIAFL